MFREYWSSIRAFSPNARRYLTTTALLGLTFGLQYLFFNLYVLSLGFDQAFVGTLASIPALVTAVSAIPIGLLLPRFGFRRSLVAGGLLLVIALLGWALVPSRTVLVISSALFGLGSSLLWICSSPLMVAVSHAAVRTYLFGLQFALNTLSGVAANLIGGYLPRLLTAVLGQASQGSTAYRGVLLIALVLTLLAMIPVIRLRGLPADKCVPVRWPHLQRHRKSIGKLLFIQLSMSLGAGLLMPFINVFYRLRFGVPDPSLGALFAVSSLMTGLAGLLAPVFAGRLGKIRTVFLTQGLSIPFLIAMGFIPSFGLSAGGYLIRTALMNMSAPVFTAYSMGLVPAGLRPLTSSLMTLAWNAGWAAAAWTSGKIQLASGFSTIFTVTLSIYAVVIALTYVFFRNTAELGAGNDVPEPSPAETGEERS